MKSILLINLVILFAADSITVENKLMYLKEPKYKEVVKGDTTRILLLEDKPFQTWEETLKLIEQPKK